MSSATSNTPAKAFASQADLEEKKVSFTRLSEHAYAYTAEGDPNTGIVIGDDAVMVIDTQATPVMAADVIRRIREVTDKPIKYVVLSHYHAVRVLGASAYASEHVIASDDTLSLIKERGEQDKASEIGRFPRLFRNVESVPPGLTWPTLTFTGKMTLWLGRLEVQLLQLGRGHTKGDTVVWLPQERILFSGDLVEFDATPYAGDAYFSDWPQTLDRLAALHPAQLVPGRGAALQDETQVAAGLAGTRAFVADVFAAVKAGAAAGQDLKTVYRQTMAAVRPKYGHWVIFDHCMPFDVTRAYDEATAHRDPRIWTAQRDIEMWQALETWKTVDAGDHTMKIERIHHVAYRCRDAKQTVDWYGKHLGMNFVLAIAEDQVPSTHAPDPYMHVFLDAGGGNILAFFELPNALPMGRDEATPDWVQHLALKVAGVAELEETKARLQAAGIDVVGVTDHTLFKSIYFFDPNGHRVELAADTATPDMGARLDAVKWEMLQEWSRTRRAPKHAAWMHERELGAS